MSFYVTLPSNSSMDLYPNNTLSEFAVQLKDPIRLDVQYEVALVEFTYKHSWSLEVGKLVIDLLNERDYDTFNLVYHDGESISSFTHRLNGEIWTYYIKKEYNRRYELNKKGFLTNDVLAPPSLYSPSNLNHDVIKDIRKSEWFKSVPSFTNDPFKFVIYQPGYSRIKFEGDILKILNLENNWYRSTTDNKFLSSGLIEDPSPSIIQTLFIYCDIIDYQYVGNAYVPLLRNVVVDNSYLKTSWVQYDNPHYLNINKSEISVIRVEIRDDTGRKVKFDNGKVIAKLHFRPKIV